MFRDETGGEEEGGFLGDPGKLFSQDENVLLSPLLSSPPSSHLPSLPLLAPLPTLSLPTRTTPPSTQFSLHLTKVRFQASQFPFPPLSLPFEPDSPLTTRERERERMKLPLLSIFLLSSSLPSFLSSPILYASLDSNPSPPPSLNTTTLQELEMENWSKDFSRRVVLIRHGEKPEDGGIGLSHEGKKRAQCLRRVRLPPLSLQGVTE